METGSESGCMQKTVRGLFIAFNILFCIIGVILIGVGSYAVHKANTSDYEKLLGFLSDKPDFDDVMDNDNPSPSEDSLIEAIGVKNGLLAVGGFIITLGLATFMISTCGWLGACRQNACMLFTFSIVMIVIVLIELILGIVAVVVVKKINGPDGKLSEDIAGSLLKSGDEAFNYHGNDTKSNAAIRDAWDTAQTHGECCGVNNPLDWMNASFTNLTLQSNTYPASCIDKSNKTPNTPYEMGCWQSVKQVLGRMSRALGGTAIFFCLVEIFGVVISCYLAFNMRKGGSQYEQH